MQSFLNAGYTPQEVELAANKVAGLGISEIGNVEQIQTSPIIHSEQVQRLPISPMVVETKTPVWMVLLLLFSLGLVVAALILVFIFRDSLF